jgi:hypothetical protein
VCACACVCAYVCVRVRVRLYKRVFVSSRAHAYVCMYVKLVGVNAHARSGATH